MWDSSYERFEDNLYSEGTFPETKVLSKINLYGCREKRVLNLVTQLVHTKFYGSVMT